MKRALLTLLLLAGLAAAQNLQFAASRPFDLTHLRLDAHVDLKAKTLKGTVRLDMTALRATSSVRLDAKNLQVHEVTVLRGEPAQPQKIRFANEGDHLEIFLPQDTKRGERFAVHVLYTCQDPELGLAFFGPTKAEPDVPYQVWSQGETIGTRHWIPIFDHPGERLTSELRITVDKDLQVLSNGRRVSVTARPDGTAVWHWRQEKDHVPYLITLVVGKFAIKTVKWRGRNVDYWVPPDRAADIDRAFGNTVRMLDFFSDRIGVEYPWAKYTQIVVEQFRHGGMENTSATTLNERTLHDTRAHLDYSSDGLVAHELAHQWFGDLLTCRDWAHTWLNEGFATYFEALWAEHDLGRDEFLHNMRGKADAARNGGRKLPIVHRGYTGSWQQFDARAYPKGAWVLHMIRSRLGDKLWWESVYRYTTKHAHQCVETVDLRKAIEETTGRSFERFFHDWTGRPGHPVVSVRHRWNDKERMMEVRVRQTQKAAAFHFPLLLEYRMPENGERKAVTHDVTEKDVRFFVPLKARPELVRVDPLFTVLMELSEDKGRALWRKQLLSDPSPILRQNAARHFGKSKRDPDRRLLADALGRETFWGVQTEIAAALGKSGGTVSRDVLLQALSLEHPRARRAVVQALAKFHNDATVTGALEGIVQNGDASYAVEGEAIRAWSAARPEGALGKLEPLLARDSHKEQIRTAALHGIGDQLDPAATTLLLEWTQRGKPRPCRRSALEALGKLARSGHWDGDATRRVVETVSSYLQKSEARGIKTAASQILRDLGAAGTPALAALEALVAHDSNDNVRKEARAAIDKIHAGAPARIELTRLREELRKMREQDRKLRERLERLEGRKPG